MPDYVIIDKALLTFKTKSIQNQEKLHVKSSPIPDLVGSKLVHSNNYPKCMKDSET